MSEQASTALGDDAVRWVDTTTVQMRCIYCSRVVGQSHVYVNSPRYVHRDDGSIEEQERCVGPVCDDCANRRRA